MRGRERIADAVAGQTGRQRRKAFVRSLEETAARAVVTASVTFAVGWVLKRMFEKSVSEAAKEGAKDGVDEKVAKTGAVPDVGTATASTAPAQPTGSNGSANATTSG
ncbi:hypothetical protein [Novosphingobium sp. JCM 18896]|uniref:hypothetical protein n=1 Tax=Novosphingobium sp. JCM 18896 TaxID=2989731 RepID=UPI0022217BCE|nr:hypothetical protein [Novosphingobium sp. JCM 18896]MCW1430282.1 hypothetical protein [Novosphingobium sp. JCM 18896]